MKILGIGSALTDLLYRLPDDEWLNKLGLAKGSMTLINKEESLSILKKSDGMPRVDVSGGSAANMICGLATLGTESGFIGKTGNDGFGAFFSENLKKTGASAHIIITEDDNSGTALTFVSPDSDRTFATYLGASSALLPEELSPDIFGAYDMLYMEGYLVFNTELVNRIVEIVQEKNMLLAIDMASFNVVAENLPMFEKLVYEHADFVFANEHEAFAFTGKDPENAAEKMSGEGRVVVVKTGADGSIVSGNGNIIKVPACKATPIDTTGAGDLYAAGFLYGVDRKAPLHTCARIGSLVAAKVIETMGPKISDDEWFRLKEEIKNY